MITGREIATKSWASENAEGRRQAAELINLLRAGGQPFLLGDAVKSMIRDGRYTGVEVGFFNFLACELIACEKAL